jgi:hypothetical protein
MNKDKVEQIFRDAGLQPEEKVHVRDYNVFIADGFALPPYSRLQRFGIETEDFPTGCYCTFWWAGKDENLHAGRPLFFDPRHEPDYDLTTRKKARLSAALKDAEAHIEKWNAKRLSNCG